MKKMKVAVFGHYDSRGGTTAMPLSDEPTLENVKEAMRKYDENIFGWTAMLKEAQQTYDENPANFVWNPYEEKDGPSKEDFLYVADLHYPDTLGRTVHTKPTFAKFVDFDEEPYAVLLDDGTEDMPTSAVVEFGKASQEDVIRWFIGHPAQLEIVYTGERPGVDDDVWEEYVTERAKVLKRPACGYWNNGFLVDTGL